MSNRFEHENYLKLTDISHFFPFVSQPGVHNMTIGKIACFTVKVNGTKHN